MSTNNVPETHQRTPHQHQNVERTSDSINWPPVARPATSYHRPSPEIMRHLQENDPYRAFLCSQRPASASNIQLPDPSRDFGRPRASQRDETGHRGKVVAIAQYQTLEGSSPGAPYNVATGTSALPQYPVANRSKQAAGQYVCKWTAYWESLAPDGGNNNDRGKSRI
ncbi:MAG: hypothetical protein FRX48_04762 [Lasallia pustulata]|uniref:Uncharacterized protein n=1 Tax=Lasallia pustulata TaxID=136370 RepID=A0A5M8PR07_9LECA|nr:MAG: hypothetical protein FRX48_04762 [Lasallia pustulata]